MEKLCSLVDLIGARGVSVESVLRRIRSQRSNVKDLVLLVVSRGLSFEPKS